MKLRNKIEIKEVKTYKEMNQEVKKGIKMYINKVKGKKPK
jgi:ketopantoate hydroxymethyltransferase